MLRAIITYLLLSTFILLSNVVANTISNQELLTYAQNGDINSIKALNITAKQANITNENGENAIVVAIQNNQNIEVIKALVELKVDINRENKFKKWTPLVYALSKANESEKQTQLVFDLIDIGAVINPKKSKEWNINALLFVGMVGSYTPNFRVINYNKNQIANQSIVDYAIKNGADINSTNVYDDYALVHLAAIYKNTQAIYFLSKDKANFNVETKNKHYTPLMLSVVGTIDRNIFLTIMNKDVNTDAKDIDNATALILSTRYGDKIEPTIYLLETGANPNLLDKMNMSAYDYIDSNLSYSTDDREVIKKVFALYIVNAPNKREETAKIMKERALKRQNLVNSNSANSVNSAVSKNNPVNITQNTEQSSNTNIQIELDLPVQPVSTPTVVTPAVVAPTVTTPTINIAPASQAGSRNQPNIGDLEPLPSANDIINKGS